MSCKLGEVIQNGIHTTYSKWGHFVGRNPWRVIACSTLIALICMIRLVFPIETEVRDERLFAPQDSEAFEDMIRYTNTFGSAQVRTSSLIFTTKKKGGNVLTASVLREAQRLDSLVSEHVYASSGLNDAGNGKNSFGRTYSRRDLCHPRASQPDCLMLNNPLELFYYANGTYDFETYSDAEIAEIVQRGYGIDSVDLFPSGAEGRTLNAEALFGGRSYDAQGNLVSAEAVQLVYLMEGADDATDEYFINRAWEEQVNYLIGPEWTVAPPFSEGSATNGTVTWSSETVTVYPITEGSIDRESDIALEGDVSLFTIGISLLTVYAYLVAFSPKAMLASRGALMTAGLVSSGLAIGISFSLASLFVKNNLVVSVLPFVLLGIGVDDTFVLMQGLAMSSASLPVPERMANALGHAGTSITVTSLTDIFAFLLGTTSSLPGLQAFCVFAVFGVLGDFLLQISFFAAWMALDARREAAGKHDYYLLNPCGCATPAFFKRYFTLQQLVQLYYVPLLRLKPAKALVIVSFVSFCAAMAYCASNLKQDFDQRWFIPSDSKLWDAFDIEDQYFGAGTGLSVYVVTPASPVFDYTTVASQGKLLELKNIVNANDNAVSTLDWYSPLRAWAHACVPAAAAAAVPAYCALGGKAIAMVTADGKTVAGPGTPLSEAYVPPARFYEYLAEYISSTTYGQTLSSGIKWRASCAEVRVSKCSADEVVQGLLATQLTTYIDPGDTAEKQVDSMRSLRSSVAKAGIDGAYAYTFVFVFFEQFAIIITETLTNLSLAGLATFALVLLTVSSLPAALYCLLMVIMVDVDILGLMWLSGLTIDSVTIINLVLAIGLVVDYSAHIAHSFVFAKGSRQERADHALSHTGRAVFHGGMSTFVAVIVMATSTSYIFQVFFIQFFGICVFGMAHGLVFLPVLLSLVGPGEISVGKSETPATQEAHRVELGGAEGKDAAAGSVVQEAT